MPIVPWSSISAHHKDCVILGNGASIALAKSLAYSSLYTTAASLMHLSAKQEQVFQFFGTQDFEFVLHALSNANAINKHLSIHETETADAYQDVRDALIKTVKAVHPDHNVVSAHFDRIAKFLSPFPTVFSLNYDLMLYWSMMHANDKAGGNLFKDCFKADAHFESDYDYLRKPHKSLPTSTLVFFPHGNLVLTTNMWGTETKIAQAGGLLLDAITSSWTLGGYAPLFVSEGDSDKKLRSVLRNPYLNQVYSELCQPRKSIVIYGWGVGKQDSHILN